MRIEKLDLLILLHLNKSYSYLRFLTKKNILIFIRYIFLKLIYLTLGFSKKDKLNLFPQKKGTVSHIRTAGIWHCGGTCTANDLV